MPTTQSVDRLEEETRWCQPAAAGAHHGASASSSPMRAWVGKPGRGRLVKANYTRSIWARVALPGRRKRGKPSERANQEVEKPGAEVHPQNGAWRRHRPPQLSPSTSAALSKLAEQGISIDTADGMQFIARGSSLVARAARKLRFSAIGALLGDR